MHLPSATIRTQVMPPLRCADGFGAHTLDLSCDDVLDAEP
jgi:hypothetical protein